MEHSGFPSESAEGCAFHGAISLGASMLGSLVGTVIFTAWELATSPVPDAAPLEAVILVGMIVMMTGAFIGIPIGMLAGIPLLAYFGPIIIRHRVAMSFVLGLIGLLLGWIIGSELGHDESRVGLVFGSAIGALHAILYPALTE